ncbi:MAG TPA: DciA family protein [bacterium]|nr:DciA family protein [bacterium]HOL49713.1 DciA family protein [bacterium]HPO51803.1 DciA family protein [bacterium]HXK44796.1 DciA family protein [bacterium]
MKETKLADIVGDVLKNILKNTGKPEQVRHEGIIDWDKIWAEVCEKARPYSYVVTMFEKTLVVRVKNSAWVLELRKNEKEIINKLQARTGRKLEKIMFVR